MWVLKYIASTLQYGIAYTKGNILSRFCASDKARSVDNKRSVMIRCCFSLRSRVVSWVSKKQPMIALSSTEDEYKSTCFASCEAVQLRMILGDMGTLQSKPTQLLCNNQSCIAIAKNLVFHFCTKHIVIQYQFVCKLIMDGEVDLVYYPVIENATNVFTKALGRDLLERHIHRLSIGSKKQFTYGWTLRGGVRY